MSTIETTYLFITFFLGMSATIKSFEIFALGNLLEKDGALDWPIVGPDWLRNSPFKLEISYLYKKRGMCALGICSLITTILICVNIFHWENLILLKMVATVLLICHFTLYYRQDFGTDGADQMSLIIALTVFICCSLNSNPTIQLIGILFVTSQLCIAYLASGFSKLFSASWRTGAAARGVLSTVTYGNSLTRMHIRHHEKLSLAICWATILWECLFPAIFLFDGVIFMLGVSVGAIFHILVANIMGLNAFIWAFGAAYPAIIYVGFYVI